MTDFMKNTINAQINDIPNWDIYELGEVCVYVCVCMFSKGEKMQKRGLFLFEKIVINYIVLCFLLATKFVITLCLIKHQIFLVLQMAIRTYRNILYKPKTKFKIQRSILSLRRSFVHLSFLSIWTNKNYLCKHCKSNSTFNFQGKS